jgi:hypothetical protein
MPRLGFWVVRRAAEQRASGNQDDGAWPDNPQALVPGDVVRLESISFAVPLAAFYRTT